MSYQLVSDERVGVEVRTILRVDPYPDRSKNIVKLGNSAGKPP